MRAEHPVKAKDEELAKKVTAEETARKDAVNQLNKTINAMDSAAVSESVKGLTAKLSAETTARKNAVAATDKAVGALQTRG